LPGLKPAFMISLLDPCAPREALQACYSGGTFFVKLNTLPRSQQADAGQPTTPYDGPHDGA
jgi:hypothetical protein